MSGGEVSRGELSYTPEMCYHIMAAKMAVGMTLIRERSTLRNCIATNGNEPTRLPAGSSRDCEMSILEFRGFLD